MIIQDGGNRSKPTNRKKSVKQNRNLMKVRILPFYTIIFVTTFKIVKIVAWFSQNPNPASEPQASLFSFPFNHASTRFLFLSYQAPYNIKGPLRRREISLCRISNSSSVIEPSAKEIISEFRTS